MWSRSLETAVANLVATGVSVVVAAGNSAKDSCQVAPARVPEAVTVAASNLPTKFQETSSGMFAAQHATERCTAWYVELHGGECSSLPDLNPATSALSKSKVGRLCVCAVRDCASSTGFLLGAHVHRSTHFGDNP